MAGLLLVLAIACVFIAVFFAWAAAQFWFLRHDVDALRARLERLERASVTPQLEPALVLSYPHRCQSAAPNSLL